MRVIYDVGANNGDDVPYYLLKADLVVAVEANPVLAAGIRRRFAAEIAAGRLAVEGCAVTADEEGEVAFYVHRQRHVESQFPRPAEDRLAEFEKIEVPARSLMSVIGDYGAPYYVKIDVEHYDHVLLRALFRNGVFPPYLSAESHEIEVFAALVALGGYRAFKLVEGATVPEVYGCCRIEGGGGAVAYSFPAHAAGPFGNDIAGPWYSAGAFFGVLAGVGLGWRDVHVSRVDLAER